MTDVMIPGSPGELLAYVARPVESAPWPGVVVLHDAAGMSQDLRNQADWLASEGFLAAAPDLYYPGGKIACIRAMIRDATARQGKFVADIEATRTWLSRQEGCTDKIGVIGFCMGGSYAMALPCVSRDIKAAAPFYGEIPPDEKLQNLNCPVFYAYGENDGWIQRKDVDRLAGALRKFNKPGEVKVYSGCSHGFFNDTRADVYSAKDARDAWERSLKLFEQNLKHR